MTTINPFTQMLAIYYVRFIKRDAPIREELLRKDYYDVEQQTSVRVYKDAYEAVEQLTDLGHKLMRWIMYHIPDKAVSIKLGNKTLMSLFKCSDRQVLRMKADLLRCAVIAKRENNEYWVNPRYFAAGNRIQLYPDHTVRAATIREQK